MDIPVYKKAVVAILTLSLLSCTIYLLPITRYRMIYEPLVTASNLPSNPTSWNSTNLRLMEWASSIQGIKMAGPFGTGTGGTWPALKQYSSQYNLGVFSGEFNSHNQYLETFLEIGVAGFIGLLACYFIPLSRALQTKNYLLLSFSLIVCLASLTESILERAHGLIFFTTFASILMYSKAYDSAA
jgi:O-antigen ligase